MTSLANITRHPKSSLNGVLGLVIVALLSLHFDVAGHLTMAARDWAILAAAVVRAAVLLTSVDAGTVTVETADGKTASVDGHETPYDPAAGIPVKPEA